MFSPCLCGFSLSALIPQSKSMHGVCVCPAMDGRHVQGVFPAVTLCEPVCGQAPANPCDTVRVRGWWNNGWLFSLMSQFYGVSKHLIDFLFPAFPPFPLGLFSFVYTYPSPRHPPRLTPRFTAKNPDCVIVCQTSFFSPPHHVNIAPQSWGRTLRSLWLILICA